MITPTLLFVVGRHTALRRAITARRSGGRLPRRRIMALAVWSMNQLLAFTGPVRLGLDILLGMIVYIGTLMALWNISGRPLSAERDVISLIEYAQAFLGTIRARVLKMAQ